MESWRYEMYQNELYHHGILGMKWGKRNGPPYPLDETDKSSAEKKAESGEKRKGLTDNQKRAIKMGAAVVGTALVTYGAYKISKSPVVKSLASSGLDAVKGMQDFEQMKVDAGLDLDATNVKKMVDSSDVVSNSSRKPVNDVSSVFKRKPDADRPRDLTDIQDDLDACNPSGNKSNCTATVLAYIFRKDGWDVSARYRDNLQNYSYEELNNILPGFSKRFKGLDHNSRDMRSAIDDITNELKKHPDGAAGLIKGSFSEEYTEKVNKFALKMGVKDVQFNGHSMAWEKVGDKIVFSDPQDGRIIGSPLSEWSKKYDKDGFKFARMDDLKVDKDDAEDDFWLLRVMLDGK